MVKHLNDLTISGKYKIDNWIHLHIYLYCLTVTGIMEKWARDKIRVKISHQRVPARVFNKIDNQIAQQCDPERNKFWWNLIEFSGFILLPKQI